MITSKIVSSSSVLTPYANTMQADGEYIHLTSILNAGTIVIDDVAIDVEPISFFSPIKCKKIGTPGVAFMLPSLGSPRGSLIIQLFYQEHYQ
jgi:hypothetical protein